MYMKNKIWYIDSTLRDGEQAPGVSFTHSEKFAICCLLDSCGIDEVEVGTPAMGKNEIEIIKSIASEGFLFRTSSWCRALKSDIDAARKCNTDGINISFPLSDIQLKSINKSMEWVFQMMRPLINYAQNYFQYVSVGAQDASRSKYSDLEKFIDLCILLNTHRIRIADTIGTLNPISTVNLFESILKVFPEVNLEFHGHNDLGMATANAIAAIQTGATSVSTTINGLGERAGNASFDEVVMACRMTLKMKDSINSKLFSQMAQYLEKVSGRKNSPSKPITGSAVYQHESGIHTKSLLKNSASYQLINGEETGKSKPEIVYGTHSGAGAISNLFLKKGISIDSLVLGNILEQIKLFASIKKKSIEEDELLDIYYRMT